MNSVEREIQTIKQNLKGVRNEQIYSRAEIIIRVLESKNKTTTLISLGWKRNKFYFWLRRLRQANYDVGCLVNLSRAPKTNKRAISEKMIKLALDVRAKNNNVGAANTAYFLKSQHDVHIHSSTLGYIFRRLEISKKYRIPQKNPHNKRYSLEKPMDRVQMDTLNLGIVDSNQNPVKAYPIIDDCSRLTEVHIADEHSNHEATNAIEKFILKFGKPASVQTDNGVEYTNRYISECNTKRKKEPMISGFEQCLQEHKIYHKLIKPRTPQLNGKVERFNQTFKKGIQDKIKNGMSIAEIQSIANDFLEWYNKKKPHCSLNLLTPYEVFVNKAVGAET